MSRQWYCAETQINQEFSARDCLERMGFPTFLPAYLVKSKCRHIASKLLFKNYIFFHMQNLFDWPRVHRAPYIKRVMTSLSSDKSLPYLIPASAASDEIESLRAKALTYDEIRRNGKPRRTKQIISAGCHVRILRGPLMDHPSAHKALVDWSDDDRASLALQMFNGEAKIEFYINDLELVEHAPA